MLPSLKFFRKKKPTPNVNQSSRVSGSGNYVSQSSGYEFSPLDVTSPFSPFNPLNTVYDSAPAQSSCDDNSSRYSSDNNSCTYDSGSSSSSTSFE